MCYFWRLGGIGSSGCGWDVDVDVDVDVRMVRLLVIRFNRHGGGPNMWRREMGRCFVMQTDWLVVAWEARAHNERDELKEID